jgi:hypothetical protein
LFPDASSHKAVGVKAVWNEGNGKVEKAGPAAEYHGFIPAEAKIHSVLCDSAARLSALEAPGQVPARGEFRTEPGNVSVLPAINRKAVIVKKTVSSQKFGQFRRVDLQGSVRKHSRKPLGKKLILHRSTHNYF